MKPSEDDKSVQISMSKRTLTLDKEEASTCLKTARVRVQDVMHVYSELGVDPSNVRALEKMMLSLINRDRLDPQYVAETKSKARALIWDEHVAQVARAYSWEMAMRNFFSHHNPENQTAVERISRINVKWLLLGENIGVGQDVAAAHFGFMDEPPFEQNHRANILNPEFSHAGIGICRPSDGVFFISEIFLKLRN